MADKCVWREDENGWWWTGCDAGYPIGNWEVEVPTPEGSGYKFCPECGGKIVGIGYLDGEGE